MKNISILKTKIITQPESQIQIYMLRLLLLIIQLLAKHNCSQLKHIHV
jgi:hypothetical protein